MKHQTNPEILTQHRPRNLRNHPTDAESLMWRHLRSRQIGGAKFRRQHALGNYVVDFASFDSMLIVELDGGQHASQVEYDALRDAYLTSAGFKVLRFWNNDVMQNGEGVLETIRLEVMARTSTPSPP